MAKTNRASFQKLEREKARQQKNKNKQALGILPGPQLLPEHWAYATSHKPGAAKEAQDDNL